MIDQFVLTTTQEALALDCLRSSHAIQTNVNDPRQIEAMFDTISYKKVCKIWSTVDLDSKLEAIS